MSNFRSGLAELRKIGALGYWGERIVTELEYGLEVSKANESCYDRLLGNAVEFVSEKFRDEGVISRVTALTAEEMLSEIKDAAKAYNILCVGHAHIDMNWMWRWDETVSITLDTFRTMLDLMEEYPEFTFAQSQASVYKIVEEYYPEMLEEIKERVKEGRWEVTATTWVEPDKNMPVGESLARHILYTRKYLSKLLDINPESLNIDFEPDTFGHSLNVPEIATRGGIKYYYHCRGYDGHNIYRWMAPSGSSILVYREPVWYNAEIKPDLALYVPEFCRRNNTDTMLKVYGVGDHGGGPTRRDIERLIDMNSWPVYPQIRFGTYAEYFGILEKIQEKLPVVEGELNFIFTGCYTTQTRIKMANRVGEAALNEAEAFDAVSALCAGSHYSSEAFMEAWINVLFNHFHDIIPGSGKIDTREYAMGLFQKTMAIATSRKNAALRKISAGINTSMLCKPGEDRKETCSEGAGVGFGIEDFKLAQVGRGSGKTRIYHFFNPAPFEKEEVAEVVVWDWKNDLNRIVFKDASGNIIPHQVIDHGFNNYWGHDYVQLLVKVKVPALGYTTCAMTEADEKMNASMYLGDHRTETPFEYTLENELIKVCFDYKSLSIVSLTDKRTGEEFVDKSMPAGIFRYIEEDTQHGMTAWYVGRHVLTENLVQNVKVRNVSCRKDALRQSIFYNIEFKDSWINVTVSLDKNSTGLKYSVECDWHEIGIPGKKVPQLGFYMPLNYECATYKYDVPFGVIEREGMNMDVPGNSWAMGVCNEKGRNSVMLVTDSKYGFRSYDNSMAVTLIRSSYDPDPYPEFGKHRFNITVSLIENSSNRELINHAYSYNHPVNVISDKPHDGTLPLSGSFIQQLEGSVAVSAVKMPENTGGKARLILRVYEVDGNRTCSVFSFFKDIKKAYYVDINENTVEKELNITAEGSRVTFDVLPYSIESICVEF